MTQEKERKTTTYIKWELSENFKNTTHLLNEIRQCEDFYNGNQYQTPNKNNQLRLQLNVCAYGVQTTASKLNGTPIYLTFTSQDFKLSSKLSRFDDYNLKNMCHDQFRYRVCINAGHSGTAITHIVWDKDATKYKGIYKGGVREERVPIEDFAVANPYLEDLQSQKYIIQRNYLEIGQIYSLIDADNDKECEYIKRLIQSENYDQNGTFKNKSDAYLFGDRAYVYFEYFRVNGEVFYIASTKRVNLFKYPHSLNPKINKNSKILKDAYKKWARDDLKEDEIDLDIDWENALLNTFDFKEQSDENYQEELHKFGLYPFAKYVPIPMNESFYGKPLVSELISSQKIINFFLTGIGKSLELTAFPKLIVKDRAVRQKITGRPDEILYDYSKGNGLGIGYLQPPAINSQTFTFVEYIQNAIAKYNGFNDILGGSITNQDISGYAYQLALKQSNSTIEQQQKLLWSYEIDLARIRLQYYRFYVDKEKFLLEITPEEIETNQNYKAKIEDSIKRNGKLTRSLTNEQIEQIKNSDIPRTSLEEFDGEEYKNVEFDISVDAVQGVLDSAMQEAELWNTLLMNGNLQNIPTDNLALWLKSNPTVPPRIKDQIDNLLKQIESSKLTQITQENEMLKMQLQQVLVQANQLKTIVERNAKYSDELTKQFSTQLSVEKRKNGYLQEKNRVSEGEAKSNNARGINGSDIVGRQI